MSGSNVRGLLLWLALTMAAMTAPADERILDYDVDVQIHADARVTVTEAITVRAEGRDIRRGIYRDFPTRYRDRTGHHVRVSFEVLDVSRDGQPESWHQARRRNGVRVYVGREDQQLAPGTYRYTIRYRTHRQIGYFEDADELYWNVTGSGWAFPIDHARATVTLPDDVPASALELAAYTGPQGARGEAAGTRVVDSRTVQFQTTAALAPNEGLTIAVAWPKGLVHEPDMAEKARWFLADNSGTLALLLGLLATLAWYLWAWNRAGRDPEKGVIIPRFKPPAGLSPAACAYVRDMSLGQEAFTAAVVSLGVKGHLAIEEVDGDYTLRRRNARRTTPPSPGEQAVFDALLPVGTGHVALEQENHAAFRAARAGLKAALAAEYRNRLFRLNGHYALPAIAISVLALLLSLALATSVFAWIIYGAVMVPLHGVFLFLMRAPTEAGRRVMDEIEGFRMYLGTAEQDRLQAMRSPALTPEVFEQFLPYAFALDVENDWCRRFEREFPQPPGDPGGFQPAWYSGNFGRHSTMSRLSSGLSHDLGGAIAASSTPPGSSSGSGGGGFSGGGGGGGGGGGW